MAIDKSIYLQEVLDTYKMTHIEELVNKHKEKRNEIAKILNDKYSEKIYRPFNSGSFGKHTAINTKFDLDLVVPFKRDSFQSLHDMFDDVFSLLEDKYKEIATVRKQKVSIGVIFKDDISIDVVPGRELIKDDYSKSKDLNLYFNDNHWGIAKGSYTKTNIQAQIDHIKAKKDERKIIRLLKIWKTSNNEKYKSFLFELIVIKALSKVVITECLWIKLKYVIEYIKDNVDKENFSLKDPGNLNNNVTATLNENEKYSLVTKMNNILNRIEDNEENIKSYFPVNDEFKIKLPTEKSYGLKGAKVTPSIPINNQRFG